MYTDNLNSRRKFMGTVAATAGLSMLSNPLFATQVQADPKVAADAEAWFKKVKGKHKIIYDAPEPNDGFGIIWSWAFYKTNNETGTPDNELTSVVVLRHGAIPIAMQDNMWGKYKLGETFKINDSNTSAPAVKNPFWIPDSKMWLNFGIQGIKSLQERGVMFCVCDLALTVYSTVTAQAMSLKPEEVKKEWVDNLLPGVQVVPSGVWAVGRAQEKGCAYCFAG
jgi:intracellular sulfur oxidation DsrE/DsrF family protein